MPTVMKLITLNNCFNNGYELRGSMGNRHSSNLLTTMNGNGNSNESQCHLTRSSTRNRLKEPLTVECNGFTNSVSVSSDGVLVEKDAPGRLCRSKSKSCPGNGSQLGPLSPTDGVRPRRNIWKLPSCLLGTTAEDNHSPTGMGNMSRTNNSISSRSKSDTSDTIHHNNINNKTDTNTTSSNHSVPCKVRCASLEETSSPEDKKTQKGDRKFLEDNEKYYKVEVLSSKLRSTSSKCIDNTVKREDSTCSLNIKKEYDKDKHISNKLNEDKTELIEQNGDISNTSSFDEEIYGGIRKKTRQQQSQSPQDTNTSNDYFLSRNKLKQKHSFINNSSNSNNQTTPNHNKKFKKKSLIETLNMEADKFMFGDPRKELEELEDKSSPEIITPNNLSSNIKRKRKSHAELFLIDNLDYYKFELPASRLRNGKDDIFHYCPKMLNDKNNSTSTTVTPIVSNKALETINEQYKDEKEPDSDSDMNNETKGIIKIDFNKIKYSFELGIQKELWYNVFLRSRNKTKQSLWLNKIPIQSKILLPYERKSKQQELLQQRGPKNRLNNNIPQPPLPPPPPPPPLSIGGSSSNETDIIGKRRKRRLSSILEEDRPRKSPRCHASTQAILSSQPPKRSLSITSSVITEEDEEEEENNDDLYPNLTHEPERFPNCCDFSRTNPYSYDVRRLVDKLSKQMNLDISKLNLCEILIEYSRTYYQNYTPTEHDLNNEDNNSEYGGSSNLSTDGNNCNSKKLRHKKRRINMTGWPCRPKRRAASKVNYNENIPSISTSPLYFNKSTTNQNNSSTHSSLDLESTTAAASSSQSTTVCSTYNEESNLLGYRRNKRKTIKKRKIKASNRYKY